MQKNQQQGAGSREQQQGAGSIMEQGAGSREQQQGAAAGSREHHGAGSIMEQGAGSREQQQGAAAGSIMEQGAGSSSREQQGHICKGMKASQTAPPPPARRGVFISKIIFLKLFLAACIKKKRIDKKTKGNTQENCGLPFVSKRIGKFKSY